MWSILELELPFMMLNEAYDIVLLSELDELDVVLQLLDCGLGDQNVNTSLDRVF